MQDLCAIVVTPSLCVSYDATNHWLYNQWLGIHNQESVRLAAETIFLCLAAHPCTKMLSDHSLLQGDWQAAIPSVVQRNFARLAAHQVRYVAWVHSFEYGDLVAMERVVRDTSEPPLVGLFGEVASAYDWLLHCPVDLPRRIR